MPDPFRLNEVPTDQDLEKIERGLERRPERSTRTADGYSERDLLEYSLEREEYSGKNIEDYSLGSMGKWIQGVSTAGAGGLTAMFGGDYNSVFLASGATYLGSDIALRKTQQLWDDPEDEELEEALEEFEQKYDI